ncbi:hypothetical protein ADIS_3225 [Lunatimonas lonarensis]|uniref:Uncharacterized protein n=1 Tax=Lunatimonas lonarensis TaxID=1232681 RepID=R7ZPU6_9BACT|nr:hypothetical protein ADIS_3225 [Lunatimonas lonarensis]
MLVTIQVFFFLSGFCAFSNGAGNLGRFFYGLFSFVPPYLGFLVFYTGAFFTPKKMAVETQQPFFILKVLVVVLLLPRVCDYRI